jgi:hypothetical protein
MFAMDEKNFNNIKDVEIKKTSCVSQSKTTTNEHLVLFVGLGVFAIVILVGRTFF